MIIARWIVEARFGHKQEAIGLMRLWWREIAPQIGWSSDQVRLLSASIGTSEAAIEVEIALGTLADLDTGWSKLASLDAQLEWAKELERHVVSGSPRWIVHRVVELAETARRDD